MLDPPGHPIQIVIPSALQMGWTESPLYFCTATKTSRDVIQGLVSTKVQLCHIALKDTCTQPSPQSEASPIAPLTIDNFIGTVVENKRGTLLGLIT